MSDLPTTQDVSYNGYQFSVYHKVQSVESRNVYDAATRTVTHKVVRIQISDRIHDSTNRTDNSLRTIRRQLETPGGRFVFEDKGWGPFTFNGATKDLVWGPKPQVLSWRDVGDGRAAEFTWSVEVATLDAGGKQQRAIMEFNYRISYSIDRSGYTSRTYTGHVRIPQTRASVNDRSLKDTADAYLEKVIPELMPGYRRETRERTIDESKCLMNFSVRDEQMPPNIPPPGIIDVQASHQVESEPRNIRNWHGTLSATYEIARGVGASAALALAHFEALVISRLGPGAKAVTAGGAGHGNQTIIPTRVSFSEPEIYGKTKVACSLSYSFVTDPASLIGASGLWRPVPDSDWKKWSTSIAKVLSPRGVTGMRLLPTDDAIIDLAAGRPPTIPQFNSAPLGVAQSALAGAIGKVLAVEGLQAGKSWMRYDCVLRLTPIDEVAALKKLPQAKVMQQPDVADPTLKTEPVKVPNADTNTVVHQLRAEPTVIAELTGEAIRAGFEIDPPQLASVGGKQVTAANLPGNGFWGGVIANYSVPIFAARWSLRYLVRGTPGGLVNAPANISLNPK